MAWTNPYTYKVGDLAGVDVNMTTDLTDNLKWLYNPPGARRRKNSAQAITTNVITTLALDVTVYDTDNMAVGTGVDCQTAGDYLVGGNVVFAADPGLSGGTNKRARMARIYNSDRQLSLGEHDILGAIETSIQTDLVPIYRGSLVVGDSVALQAYQTSSGGTLSAAVDGTNAPVLYAQWIGG